MTSLRRVLESTLCAPHRCLFTEWSVRRKVWETVGCAAVAGAVTGYALGVNLWLYLATAGLASLGGMPAAAQHRTLRGALLRTTVGGFVWAAAVVGVFLLRGEPATSHVPDPIGWYLLLATVPATVFGGLVWTVAHRISRARDHHQQRQPRTGRPHRPVVPLPAQAAEALPG